MAARQVSLAVSASQDHSSLPGEIWKPVPSEPGVLASSEGRILLPPRYAPIIRGSGFRAYFPKPRYGQVSKEHRNAKHTYRIIMVRRDGARAGQAPRKVHQLVCEAFHGEKPFPEAVVLHLDEDAHNNRPANLRWGTQKENLNAPKFAASKLVAPLDVKCRTCGVEFRRSDTRQKFCSTACFGDSNRKLSPEQRREAERLLREGVEQKHIAEKFGVSRNVVYRVKAKMNEAPETRA